MIEKNNIDFDVNTPLDKTRVIGWVIESLNNLNRYEMNIDTQSVTLCIDILQQYADRLECKKGVAPVVPPEIESVISLLNKVSKDMDIIRDVIQDDLKVLDQSLA